MSGGELARREVHTPLGAKDERCGGDGEREEGAEAGVAWRIVRWVVGCVRWVVCVGRVCRERRRGGERSVIAAAVEVESSCDN